MTDVRRLVLRERMGTGIRDMIQRGKDAGLPEPEIRIDSGVWVATIRRKIAQVTAQAGQVTGQVTGQVSPLLKIWHEGLSKIEIMAVLGLSGRDNFEKLYLRPVLDEGLLEMTVPDKPNSRLQKYRLTQNGRDWLAAHGGHP